MSSGSRQDQDWQPKNSKTVKAETIRKGDLVLNSTCSAWYLITTVDTYPAEGRVMMYGNEVLGETAPGRYLLGKSLGRLNAVFGENRILGW